MIDEVSRNLGLTPQQRGAAIAALRQRQAMECKAASENVMREAKGKAKARQMMKRNR